MIHQCDICDILLVEDDDTVADLLSRTIQDLSPNTRLNRIKNGTDALAFIQKSPPRSIILDLTLPGLSGLNILRKIREQPDLIDLPVVVLTGVWEDDIKGECLALGVVDFVKKPDHICRFKDMARLLVLYVLRDILRKSMSAIQRR